MSHLGQEPLRGGLAREQTCPNRSQGVRCPPPGTEKEVEAIQTLLQSKGWQVQPPYVQGKALKEILLTVQHPRVLHIATHAFPSRPADTVIDRTTCANCCREMKPTFSEKEIDRVVTPSQNGARQQFIRRPEWMQAMPHRPHPTSFAGPDRTAPRRSARRPQRLGTLPYQL